MHGIMRWLQGLLFAVLAAQATAKKDEPTIASTDFRAPLAGLFYFDDSNTLLVSEKETLTTFRSEDGGATWKPLDGPGKGNVVEVLMHPYDKNTVVILGKGNEHWISKDKGKSFKSFKTEVGPNPELPGIVFHAADNNRMIFLAAECDWLKCTLASYYTTDGFESKPKLLRKDTESCLWAKSTPEFTTGDDKLDKDEILCITAGRTFFSTDKELHISSDFFDKQDERPSMNDGSPVVGIANLASVKSFLVVAAKAPRTAELAMYTTRDTKTWQRAQFGDHKLEQDGYTLLESTNYSMQVDVQTSRSRSPLGVLLTSNTNGTYFRRNVEHTNRSPEGFVDFEKVQDIQGVVLINVVDNWEELSKHGRNPKKLKTRISFDDGSPDSWHELKADGKELHLHSVTEIHNIGRVLSSAAPGICMGVGNTGKHLEEYKDGDTYVSDDAGLTWSRALKGPHLYEFGDKGGIIVAIEDGETDKIKFSINHGKDWKDSKLPDKIKPIALTTTPDSTSLKFVLTAVQKKEADKEYVYAIDFEGLHERDCKSGDFEDWFPRVNDKGEPTCVMGHKQKFRRRKADADCFINEEFKDAEVTLENCECEDSDYECDLQNGFSWNSDKKECLPNGKFEVPDDVCKDDDDTFKGPSGYLLKPGNTCKGGKEKDEPVERKCGESKKAPVASGNIGKELTSFSKYGKQFDEYHYLEGADTHDSDEETIITRVGSKVLVTHNHGKDWSEVKVKGDIVAVYPHQYRVDTVFLLTDSKKVFYSRNYGHGYRGEWDDFEAPDLPNAHKQAIMEFHSKESNDWLIWVGEGQHGKPHAYYSTSGGDEWHTLHKDVRGCRFVYQEDRNNSESMVLCEMMNTDDVLQPVTVTSSSDWYERENNEIAKDVIAFATMAEYIVVAERDPEDKSNLKIVTSINGDNFAEAKFPRNFMPKHTQAYTVLDSATHSVFMHVTTQEAPDHEYGSIVKSNSNGTSYVLLLNDVNRNQDGYVDFEKIQGLEGTAVVNRVANPKGVDEGREKKKKTWMTHNDGADWNLVTPPKDKPSEGPGWTCSGDIIKCSLHLHGYSERKDQRRSYSSPSAIGILMATGNVGEFLLPRSKDETYTFISTDGGITWRAVAHGVWKWAYGDSGSIIVIAKETEPTRSIKYSLDEGKTWAEYDLETEVDIQDLTTVPSDRSRKFLLWVKNKGDLATISLDFSELKERSTQCKLDEKDPDADDFTIWSPDHPDGDVCLFGHVAQYHRKKPESQCYVGHKQEIKEMHGILRHCECTRKDFECDYNFERQSDNSCKLVPGLQPADPKEQCRKNPNQIEYYDVTGYRKIPISTCEGGRELDLTSTSHPCPDHEDEYQERHGISSTGLFFAIVIPIAAAAGVGYWVYQNWDGKFGRIRLGSDGPSFSAAGSQAFDREAPWVKYPVMALSGIVAVIAALPMVAGSVWNAVNTALGRNRSSAGYTRPFTSRASFARGRGDYAVVDPDEGELLGDDSDEDV